MEQQSGSGNQRVSSRKAKRKTFDDFIPLNDVCIKPRKRRTIDASLKGCHHVDVDVTTPHPTAQGKAKVVKKQEMSETMENVEISFHDATEAVGAVKCEIPVETHENGSDKPEDGKEGKSNSADKVVKTPRTQRLKNVAKQGKVGKRKASQNLRKGKHEEKPEISEKEKQIFLNKHSCKKSGCHKVGLTCCIQATNACMEASGKSSRWYHVSLEEHYCNGCFEEYYRVKNSGCDDFHEWKKAWMNNSKADANFKSLQTYISERQLPYWVQCTQCRHWRALTNDVDLTSDIIHNYTCIKGNLANSLDDSYNEDDGARRVPHIKYSCSQPNEPSVETALNPDVPWMAMLGCTPYLKHSPAAPFLTGYYPDGVGMSAVDTTNRRSLSEFSSDDNDVIIPPGLLEKINVKRSNGATRMESIKPTSSKHRGNVLTSPGGRKHGGKDHQVLVDGLNPYFQPFYKPHERGKALCMRPDVMELDEAEEFPQYYKDQTVYLAIRNLIVSLWTLDPKRVLTVARCNEHLILRGLTRVRLGALDVGHVLRFATRKGLVNIGALKVPRSLGGTLPRSYSDQKVVVVGTGPAGLAAARQLSNFGCEVLCLEARGRIGGRVHDDWSLQGVCVGRGAQIINGCINNPLAMISHQLGLDMHRLLPRCDLYDAHKVSSKSRALVKPVSVHCDKRMDFHFNALLDIIVEWRQAQQDNAEDCSLGEKLAEAHQEWIKQSGLSFTQLEERLLNFHVGNLEFACGASLDKVSAFHWDQNEVFAQFSGDHTFVQYGFGSQLESLAHGLDIRFNQPVTKVDYNDPSGKVKIRTKTESFEADRVLITVPLAVLKSGMIEFDPVLPPSKVASMGRLGCGCIEKIGILFPRRFWDSKMGGANYFGYVPSSAEDKGFFTVFYDVPYSQGEASKVLMSVISGESVEVAKDMTDVEILGVAMRILRNVFTEKEVPEPSDYFITRWRNDPYAQMAYSFVRTGGSGEDYDEVAAPVGGRLFFAGEGTNRHFPQTVTGAYLSGLREASKIAIANQPT